MLAPSLDVLPFFLSNCKSVSLVFSSAPHSLPLALSSSLFAVRDVIPTFQGEKEGKGDLSLSVPREGNIGARSLAEGPRVAGPLAILAHIVLSHPRNV